MKRLLGIVVLLLPMILFLGALSTSAGPVTKGLPQLVEEQQNLLMELQTELAEANERIIALEEKLNSEENTEELEVRVAALEEAVGEWNGTENLSLRYANMHDLLMQADKRLDFYDKFHDIEDMNLQPIHEQFKDQIKRAVEYVAMGVGTVETVGFTHHYNPLNYFTVEEIQQIAKEEASKYPKPSYSSLYGEPRINVMMPFGKYILIDIPWE